MANEFKIRKGLIVEGASGGTVVDIQGSQGQLFSVTDDLSGSIFAVSDISGVPILDINSSGISYFDGKVGIGTDNPDNILHVQKGDTTYSSQVGADTMLILETTNVSNALQFSSEDTANQYIMFGDDDPNAGWIAYAHSDNSLNFRTAGSEKMRILGSGNVGIGTVGPSSKLDVQGTVTVKGSGTGTSGSLAIQDDYSGVNHLANIGWIRSSGGVYLSYGLKQENSAVWKSTYENFSGERTYAKLDNNEFSMAHAPSQNTAVGTAVTGLTERFKFYLNTGVLQLNNYSAGILKTSSNGTVGLASSGDLPGGPYLPLTAGSGSPLTGDLYQTMGAIGIAQPDQDYIAKIYELNSDGFLSLYTGQGTPLERVRISSYGDSFFAPANNGNVGIGTTSPSYKLDVRQGSITSEYGYSSPGMSSTGTYNYGVTNTPNWNTNKGSYTNNNYTSPDDNTTAGTYTLQASSWDLYQTISATNGTEYTVGMWVKLGTATNFCVVVNNSTAWNTIGGKAFDSSDGLSSSKWTHISFTFTATSTNQVNVHIGGHPETGVPSQTAGTVFLWNIEMAESSSTWITKIDDEVRLPGNSIWKSRGNVGIGTTSPGQKLHINDGSTATTTDANNMLLLTRDSHAYMMFSSPDGKDQGIHFHNTTDGGFVGRIAYLHRSSGDEIQFKVGGSTPMILERYNVGIGTTSPGAKLEVFGTGNSFRLDSAANGSKEILFRNVGTGTATIKTDGDLKLYAEDAGKNILFDTNGGEKMRIKSNGDVGIGTTSPNAKLQVGGDVNIYDEVGDTDANLYISKGSDNTTAVKIASYGDSYLNGGNVGIGTTGPQQKLHVNNGGIRVEKFGTGLGGFISIGNGTEQAGNYSAYYFGNTANDSGYFKGGIAYETLSTTHGRGDMHFLQRTDAGSGNANISHSVMTILNGGNVGIGTSTPNAKLDVQGTQGQLFSVTDDLSGDIFSVADISGVPILNVNSDGNTSIDGVLTIEGAAPVATTPMLKLNRISPVVDYKDLNSAGFFYLKENFKNLSNIVIGSREVWQNPGGSGLYYNFDNGGSGGSQHRQKQNSFHWKINSNSEKLTLGTNGYLGVNDTSPSYQLDVNGSGRFTSTVRATNFILSSDERLKENIEKVCDNRVKADWKTFELKTDKGQKRYGVIAQELEKTNPEFVREDSQGFKSVAYIDLLIAKIAELEARLDKLEK